MKIMTLQGTDKLLYELVAPLVMNPAILRQNNNYPFKTSRSHVWYIAFHETAVVGFMPVKKGHIYYSIDNYFVSGDDPSVLSELLEEVIKDFSSQASLMAVVHKRHVKVFSQKKMAEERQNVKIPDPPPAPKKTAITGRIGEDILHIARGDKRCHSRKSHRNIHRAR